MRMSVGRGGPARGQARKLCRSLEVRVRLVDIAQPAAGRGAQSRSHAGRWHGAGHGRTRRDRQAAVPAESACGHLPVKVTVKLRQPQLASEPRS